jgi:hypothetical protein
MDPHEVRAAREFSYVISYPDDRSREASPTATDGGRSHTPGRGAITGHEIETRERLTAVESQMESNAQMLERIDSRLSGVADDIRTVEESALDKEYFRENYRGDIERNSTAAAILYWGGGTTLGILGLLATLLSAFDIPL